MIEERDEFINNLKKIGLDLKGQKTSFNTLHHSDIKAHGDDIPFSYIPLFLNKDDCIFFDEEIAKISVILEKITEHFIIDEQYRKIFRLPEKLEELILLPSLYKTAVPIGRYDLFYYGCKDYQFCEFNTDGSGGMSRDREISAELLHHDAFSTSGKNYRYEIIDSISKISNYIADTMNTLLNFKKRRLTIAVTDFSEEGVFSDFNRFVKQFEKKGFNSRFTDIRNMRFDGRNLIDSTDGTIIDAIYRRAVSSVIAERIDECAGIIEAVKNNAVLLIGSFQSTLAHSKSIFPCLFDIKTASFLLKEENEYIRRHVPQSYFLDRNIVKNFYHERYKWILKPSEGFGSKGVLAGKDLSETKWIEAINKNCDKNYIVQQFCPLANVPVCDTRSGQIDEMSLMTGIYQAGGHLAGFYSRAGKQGIIDFNHGGIEVPTIFKKDLDEL